MANGLFKLNKENFSNIFILVILLSILYLCYLLFKPFLFEIAISAMLVTIFYRVYLKIVFWTRGKIYLSSFITCFLIFLILIIPFTLFIYYLSGEAVNFYESMAGNGAGNSIVQFFSSPFWNELNLKANDMVDLQQIMIDTVNSTKGYFIEGAKALITGIANLAISLVVVFFTMFFLFIEGRSVLRRLMELTPLSNKYDRLIWMKFHDMSYSTVVASFIVALSQAIVGAIGFMIVGLPPLLGAVLIFIFSFLPYVGTVVIWLPAAVYLFVIGMIWQSIFMVFWGALAISLVDNIVRPLLIKGKANVHPMIIFFAIFGGISLMGFWGVIFGPLIVALAFTILHIYELQYHEVLEK